VAVAFEGAYPQGEILMLSADKRHAVPIPGLVQTKQMDLLISAETNIPACLEEIQILRPFELGAAYGFQHPKILQVWLETIGRSQRVQPYFVRIAKRGGGPIAFLPLGIHDHASCRVLSFLDGGVSDYNAPIVVGEFEQFDGLSMDAIWPTIISLLPSVDAVTLNKMPMHVNAFPNFLTNTRVEPHVSNGHRAILSEDWEQYLNSRPKTEFRQGATRRRLRRRLEERGHLQFVVATTRQQRDAFFHAMVQQKRRKLLETRGFDSLASSGLLAFYSRANETLAGTGLLHVSALLLDNLVLATHWGYIVGDHFYYLLPGYEEGEWARFGAGHLLNEHLLEWSFMNGIKVFDFGIGDEPYKAHWCNELVELVDFNRALTLKGRAYLSISQVHEATRRSASLRDMVRFLRKRKIIH
jgi:CelD/BcsL family acetyltransferase involved in cellulose biosynthesis